MVGTLGKALGSYGAYVCASARAERLPAQHGALLHLLDRAAAAGGRGEPGGAGAARSRAGAGRAAARERGDAARGACRRGPAGGRLAEPDRAARGRRRERTMELCERLLERGVFAQGIRPPTVPEGSSRLRFSVMATHEAEELRAGREAGRRARRASWASPPHAARPLARRRRLSALNGASSSPGPAPRSARPSSPPSSPARLLRRASVSPSSSRRSPASTSRGEPDHALLRRAAGSDAERRGDRALSLRAADLAAPGRRAGRRGDRAGAPARRRPRRGVPAPTPWSARESAACSCRSPPATWSATSPSTSACRSSIAASPGLGTINHTLLTIEAARAAGLEVAAVVLTPWPEAAQRDRGIEPRDDRGAGRGRGRDAAAPRPRDRLALGRG